MIYMYTEDHTTHIAGEDGPIATLWRLNHQEREAIRGMLTALGHDVKDLGGQPLRLTAFQRDILKGALVESEPCSIAGLSGTAVGPRAYQVRQLLDAGVLEPRGEGRRHRAGRRTTLYAITPQGRAVAERLWSGQ